MGGKNHQGISAKQHDLFLQINMFFFSGVFTKNMVLFFFNMFLGFLWFLIFVFFGGVCKNTHDRSMATYMGGSLHWEPAKLQDSISQHMALSDDVGSFPPVQLDFISSYNLDIPQCWTHIVILHCLNSKSLTLVGQSHFFNGVFMNCQIA